VFTPRRLAPLVLAAILTSLGCHAQTPLTPKPVNGAPLSPALTHRVEILLRQKAQLPPGSIIQFGPAQPSGMPGYSKVSVTFTEVMDGKTSHPVDFLISDDGKTVAQFIKYDISADPKLIVSPDGRPARGGPASAPVVIVNFDDLECPFCARFHETIFPAITQRYGDKVHIVYKDFPLSDIHPWAMHAAVDVNCLAAQSPTGYWNLVDNIHAHAADIGTDPNAKPGDAKPGAPQHTIERATAQLDKLTRDQGVAQHADAAKLDACMAKQDTAAIDANRLIGSSLDIGSTPTFFINGAKFDGAVPIDYIFARIDDALRAEGVTPPPPYVEPAPATSPAAPASNPAAAKPSPAK
jgi:protein-disulfide isomerase